MLTACAIMSVALRQLIVLHNYIQPHNAWPTDQPPGINEADSVYDSLFTDLKHNYNHRIRPYLGVKPVDVDVFIYVGSLRSISEQTMDYKLEVYFREFWKDPRLAFTPSRYRNMSKIQLHESLASLLWVPDTFLPNAIKSENPDVRSITHRSLLRLQSDGYVLYGRRLSVTAECPMDLTLYPFDQQGPPFSYHYLDGYSTEDIIYHWRKQDPIVLNDKLTLPDFQIKELFTKERNITLVTGTYSRLEACFVFVRSAGFYFIQLFIPATAIVITAWLSLWMEKESTFSDMIEVILAITFLYYSYNTVMPKVSYIKAMDIFLGGCFIFVFVALVKLSVMKHLRERVYHEQLAQDDDLEEEYLLQTFAQNSNISPSNIVSRSKVLAHTTRVPNAVRSRLDYLSMSEQRAVARLVFPDCESSEFSNFARLRRSASASDQRTTRPRSRDVSSLAEADKESAASGSFPPPPANSALISQRSRRIARRWRCLTCCRTAALVIYPLSFVLFTFFYFMYFLGIARKDANMKNCDFDA